VKATPRKRSICDIFVTRAFAHFQSFQIALLYDIVLGGL
jgi:hypothetical protein